MKNRTRHEVKQQQKVEALRKHQTDGLTALFDPAADPRHVARFTR